ncbi:transcriptional regulator [Bacterioplanes sanyensis]|uniref:AraC family transcriptional regulator n=1 Tax=Bacterioplanes sanyensis TaxID=1249553 RepID=UPI00167B27C8|nr:AraC family transcriptional regulator [Bacterioplanes sanyensis]GGY43562.1 transcriptional regulator [Bacterioplanes sanyensis]
MIPREFVDAPLRALERRGVDIKRLWREAGLPEALLYDHQHSLNSQQYTRLMGTLWRGADDEFMGLAEARSRFGTFSMMCKAIISCSTLEHALHRAQRFYALFDGAPTLRLEKGRRLSKLIIEHDLSYDPDHFLSESLLAIWHRFPSWLVDQGIPLLNVGCSYPPPPHAALYQSLFATPVSFNQANTFLQIPSRVLALPIAQTPTSLQAFLHHSPADILARPNPHQSTTGKLRRLFRQHPVDALPSLTEVARTLRVSGATLRRRLHDEQTSYQQLKDERRLEEACVMLRHPDISIHTIAECLGYTEASTFHRAFRKWQGMTPGDYRQQTLDHAADLAAAVALPRHRPATSEHQP